MNPVRPGVKAHIVDLAKNQSEYTPLPVAMVSHPGYPLVRLRITDERSIMFNTMLSCWEPSPEERAQIAAGERLYVGLLTWDKPPQPLLILTGPKAAAEAYGVLRVDEPFNPPRFLINQCEKCVTAAICQGRDMAWRCARCGRVLKVEGPIVASDAAAKPR